MFKDQNSLYYKVGPKSTSVNVPTTNVDMFLLAMPKAVFEADVDFRNVNGLNINAVYSYENLLSAVAKFPAFCSADDSLASCKKQVAAFLSITKVLTRPAAGGQALNVVEETCTPVANQIDCHYYPSIESSDYHWIAPIMKRYAEQGLLDITTSASVQYKARGAGMIQGAA